MAALRLPHRLLPCNAVLAFAARFFDTAAMEERAPSRRGNRYAVIMAGGSGTRFWPHSRRARPKQFLAITGRRTLLQDTVARLRGVVAPRRIVVVAPGELAGCVREQLPKLAPENLLIEPAPRGTAACVVLAAAFIARRDARASIAVFPADHSIRDVAAFRRCIERGFETAERHDTLVTFGIPPTSPETGYGYIEVGRVLRSTAPRVCWAKRFIEKPALMQARRLVRSRRHLWNSGIFVWRATVLRAVIRRHARALAALWEVLDRQGPGGGARAFGRLPSRSIDVAVMERAERVAVVAASFDWSDVGSWAAVAATWGVDDDGNTRRGHALLVDCRDTLAYGPSRLVAVVGARGLVVVDSGDAVLVCPRERAQDVRQIVDALERSGYRHLR